MPEQKSNIPRQSELIAQQNLDEKAFIDAALDAQLDTFFLFEPTTGKALRWNRAFTEISGYTDEEIASLRAPDSYYSPEDLARATTFIEQVLKEGTGTIELELICKDGRKVPTEYRVSLINDSKGNPKHIISIGRDISERRRSDEKIKEKELYLLKAQEIGNWGYFNYNPVSNAVEGSEQLFHIFDVDPQCPLFEAFADAVHPDDGHLIFPFIERTLQEGIPYDVEHRVRHKNGDILHVHAKGELVETSNGPRMVGIVQDITKRKRAEAELVATEKKYRSVTDNIPIAVWRSDADGHTPFVTKPAYEITGFTPDEIMSGGSEIWFGRIHPDDRERVVHGLQALFEQGKKYEVKYRYKCKDGTQIWIEEQAFNVFEENGKSYADGIFFDITERKLAENQIAEYRDHLKSLASELTLAEERLKRNLAAQIHDSISQTLAMSRMDIGLLRGAVSDQELHRSLEKLYATLGQTLSTCRSLTSDLSYPTLNVLGLEPAIKKWAQEMVQERHNIQVHIEDDDRPKPLGEDLRAVLFRGVRELLTNVIKHAHADRVHIKLLRQDNQIVIAVIDNGIGIGSELTNQQGFGLLSMHEALERLGGQITIENASDAGCHVTMTAPLNQTAVLP